MASTNLGMPLDFTANFSSFVSSIPPVIRKNEEGHQVSQGRSIYSKIKTSSQLVEVKNPLLSSAVEVERLPQFSNVTKEDSLKKSSKFLRPFLNQPSFGHIPLFWTTLGFSFGVGLDAEVILGLPCIKRFNQLYCRGGGPEYPKEKIRTFIDDNKALMRRMYGDSVNVALDDPRTRVGRSAPDGVGTTSDDSRGRSFFETVRNKRQTSPGQTPSSNREDACQSTEELVSPYWASNVAGKVRAIVNTDTFSQVIHQEVCTKTSTKRCGGDCACKQKYMLHRLLAYDPEDDCKGVFMDWFHFPSCCVCSCKPF